MVNREQIQALLADALREKYEVLKWIGGGGMAQVYLARHRVHGALFAVKVLSLDLAQDERIVARFAQEARTAATLAGHPNIVPIFDIGAENGLYFLIMQYVEGQDLLTYLKAQRKLSPRDASRIIRQVADALVWACAKNVIHRDLKPSNLYMDQSGRIVVLDFGIAKAADVPGTLTLSTERLGTPYYMSPEQIRGEHCDTRSDLYSLGIVFFELLAGRKPFEGDTYREIELAHVEKAPPDLRELDRGIPPELCAIVYKLLKKDPKERYQSAKELNDDLERQGAGVPLGLRQKSIVDGARFDGARTEAATPNVAANAPAENVAMGSASAEESSRNRRATRRLLMGGFVLLALFVLGIGLLLLLRPKPVSKDAVVATPVAQNAAAPKVQEDRLGGHMLLVAAGAFVLGSDDPESPTGKQTVNLPDFYIDGTDVSNANYRRFCEESGRKTPESDDFAAHPDLPLTNVSFEDAQAYASWIGNKQLPSEAQWEKAARGTDGRTYPWGDEAWTDAPAAIHSVSSYPHRVSPYGALNMAGNVFDWTTDHYQISPQNIADMAKLLGSPKFSHEWKIIKGGSYGSNPRGQQFWKTYMRRGFPKDIPSPVIGFRCVSESK